MIQFHVVRHVVTQLCRRPEPYEILTGSKSGVSEEAVPVMALKLMAV